MTSASFAADLKEGRTRKDDPAPGESVQPSQLRILIRRLRWTILGLEYHVRLCQAIKSYCKTCPG